MEYLFETQANPNHFQRLNVEDTPNEINPIKERLYSLLKKYSIPAPRIWTSSILEGPAWLFPEVQICLFLLIDKSSTIAEEMQLDFLSHNGSMTIYIYSIDSEQESGKGIYPTSQFTTYLEDY